jgi:anaerobic magnesium-protoporphyrin IX monomethyl ester cyclase
MTKNILLVNQFKGYEYAPVGTLFVAGALERAGYDVTLMDSRAGAAAINDKIAALEPLYVGLTVYTTPTLYQMADISEAIKAEHPTVPIAWGGIHPTILPDQCMKEPFIDHVLAGGEGELTSVQLAEFLEKKISGNHTNGHVPKIIQSDGFIKNIDDYEPAWHLVDCSKFLFKEEHSVRGTGKKLRERIFYYMVTSRGCPYRCTFCYVTYVHKSRWRPHSIAWVKKQLNYLMEHTKLDGIGFWDDFFLVDLKRAEEIMKFLGEHDVGFMCESRASVLKEEFVQKLKKYNCMQVFIGGESGSPKTLEFIKKDLTREDILSAAETCNKHELPARVSFMFGIPTEKLEDMMLTKDLILKLMKYPYVSISGPKLYTPYPGTPLYEEAIKHGFIPPKDTRGWKYMHRQTNIELLPWFKKVLVENNIKKEDIFLEIKEEQKRLNDSWTGDKLYNKVESPATA